MDKNNLSEYLKDEIVKVKDFISIDDIENSFVNLHKIITEFKPYSDNGYLSQEENNMLLLKAKFRDIKNSKIRGTLSSKDFFTHKSEIRESLLDIVEDCNIKLPKIINGKTYLKQEECVSTTEVEITIKINLLDLSNEKLEYILKSLKMHLKEEHVEIKNIKSGSVKLRIELPEDKLKLLEELIEEGKLKDIGVEGINSLEKLGVLVAQGISNFILFLTEKNLEYKERTLFKKLEKKQRRIIEQHLLQTEVQELKKRQEIELKKLEIVHQSELERLKRNYEAELVDYKEMLSELNQLKDDIEKSYPHIPKVLVHTIYYHAKSICEEMWFAPSDEKSFHQQRLLNFMQVLHEDLTIINSDENTPPKLPEKTLNKIQEYNKEDGEEQK